MLRSALLLVAAAAVAVVAARAEEDDPEELPSPTGRGFDLAVKLSDVHLAVLNTTATAESAAEALILIEEGCLPADGPPVRRLLKFSTTIRNDGDKDLVIGLPPHNRSLVTDKWEVRRQGGREWHCWLGWWGTQQSGRKSRWARGCTQKEECFLRVTRAGAASDPCSLAFLSLSGAVFGLFLSCFVFSRAAAVTVGPLARALALPQLR